MAAIPLATATEVTNFHGSGCTGDSHDYVGGKSNASNCVGFCACREIYSIANDDAFPSGRRLPDNPRYQRRMQWYAILNNLRVGLIV